MKMYKKLVCCSVLSLLTIDVRAATIVELQPIQRGNSIEKIDKNQIGQNALDKTKDLNSLFSSPRANSATRTAMIEKRKREIEDALKKESDFDETKAHLQELLNQRETATTLNPGDKQYETISLNGEQHQGVVDGLQRIANIFGVYDDQGNKTIDISLESLVYAAERLIDKKGLTNSKEIKQHINNLLNSSLPAEELVELTFKNKIFTAEMSNQKKIKKFVTQLAQTPSGSKIIKKLMILRYLAEQKVYFEGMKQKQPTIQFILGEISGSKVTSDNVIKITIGKESEHSIPYRMSTVEKPDYNKMTEKDSIEEILIHELSHAYRQILGITSFLADTQTNKATPAMEVAQASMLNNSFNKSTMDPMHGKLYGSVYEFDATRNHIANMSYDTPDEMLAITGKAVFKIGNDEYILSDHQCEGALTARRGNHYRVYHGGQHVGEAEFNGYKNYVSGEKTEANTKQVKALDKKMNRESEERLYGAIDGETPKEVYDAIHKQTIYDYNFPKYIDEKETGVASELGTLLNLDEDGRLTANNASESVIFLDLLKKYTYLANEQLNKNPAKIGNAKDVFWNNAMHIIAGKLDESKESEKTLLAILETLIRDTSISLNSANVAGSAAMHSEKFRNEYLKISQKIQTESNDINLKTVWALQDALYTSKEKEVKDKLLALKNVISENIAGYRGQDVIVGDIKLQDYFGIETTVKDLIEMYFSDDQTNFLDGNAQPPLQRTLQKTFDRLVMAIKDRDSSRVKEMLTHNKMFLEKLLNHRQNGNTLLEECVNNTNMYVAENKLTLMEILKIAKENNIDISSQLNKCISQAENNLTVLDALLQYGANPDMISKRTFYTPTGRYQYTTLPESDMYNTYSIVDIILAYDPDLTGVASQAKKEIKELQTKLEKLKEEKTQGLRSRWQGMYDTEILRTNNDIKQIKDAVSLIEAHEKKEADAYDKMQQYIDADNTSGLRKELEKKPRLSIRASDETGDTILMKAMDKSFLLFSEVLNAKGYEKRPDWINATDKNMQTILIRAIKSKNSENINAVLDHEAFKNHPEFVLSADKNGITALMYAAKELGDESFEKLFSKIALAYKLNSEEFFKEDKTGKTAFDYAKESNNKNKQEILINFAIQNNLDVGRLINSTIATLHSDLQKYSDLISQFHNALKTDENTLTDLLKQNPWLINTSIRGETALITAATNGQTNLVQKLLAEKTIKLFDKKNISGYTALKLAIKNNHKDTVKAMLDSQIYIENSYSYGAATMAAQLNNIEMFRTVTSSESYKKHTKQLHSECFNVLMSLLRWQNIDSNEMMIKEILKVSPQSLYSRDTYGWTPIMQAAKKDVGLVQLLIDEAIKQNRNNLLDHVLNAKSNAHNTALSIATNAGNVDVVKLLKSTKMINLNIEYGYNGETELMAAAGSGNLEMVTYVLDGVKDADVPNYITQQNDLDQTALIKAINAKSSDIVKYFLDMDIYRLHPENLIKEEALKHAVDAENKESFDMLLDRAYKKSPDEINALKILITPSLYRYKDNNFATHVFNTLQNVEGINFNIANGNKETPLILAAESSLVDLTKTIIGIGGINVNATNDQGETALMIAASKENAELLLTLLRHPEVKVSAVSNNGQTALSLAKAYKNDFYKALLVAKNATKKIINGTIMAGEFDQKSNLVTGTIKYMKAQDGYQEGDERVIFDKKMVGFTNSSKFKNGTQTLVVLKNGTWEGQIVSKNKIEKGLFKFENGKFTLDKGDVTELQDGKITKINDSIKTAIGEFDDQLNLITGEINYKRIIYTTYKGSEVLFHNGDKVIYKNGEITEINGEDKTEEGTFDERLNLVNGTAIYKTNITTNNSLINGTVTYQTSRYTVYKGRKIWFDAGDKVTYKNGEITEINSVGKTEEGTFNVSALNDQLHLVNGTITYKENRNADYNGGKIWFGAGDVATYKDGEIIKIEKNTDQIVDMVEYSDSDDDLTGIQ